MTEWGEWIEHTTPGRPRGIWDTGFYRFPADHAIYKKDETMEKIPSDAAYLKAHWAVHGKTHLTDEQILRRNYGLDVVRVATLLDDIGYKPPEDPLLVMAREICEYFAEEYQSTRVGRFSDLHIDDVRQVEYTLAKLREVKGMGDYG
jgi:hypothetical protein